PPPDFYPPSLHDALPICMPADPVDATGRLLAALTGAGRRTIGVGLAQDRYFTINAGLGIDAEVVRAIEGLRADGQEASAGLYVRSEEHTSELQSRGHLVC